MCARSMANLWIDLFLERGAGALRCVNRSIGLLVFGLVAFRMWRDHLHYLGLVLLWHVETFV